jgi:hypothetical protein
MRKRPAGRRGRRAEAALGRGPRAWPQPSRGSGGRGRGGAWLRRRYGSGTGGGEDREWRGFVSARRLVLLGRAEMRVCLG